MKSIQIAPNAASTVPTHVIRTPTILAILCVAMWAMALVLSYNTHVSNPSLDSDVSIMAGL